MNINRRSIFFVRIIFICFVSHISAQAPVMNKPRAVSPFTISMPGSGPSSPSLPLNHVPAAPDRNTAADMYERDKRELQQRNQELYNMLYEYELHSQTIQYDLPSAFDIQGTEHYRQALGELCGMLRGEAPLNLKKAVFVVENAYFGNQLDYPEFDQAINRLVQTAEWKARQEGYDWNHPVTKNVMLFRVMADTLEVKPPHGETTFTSYPMQYDFEDYWGKSNRTKMFVSKLLATRSGQCHSLPLLYLILCEQTGTEAFLAFSPSHSYIKFKDQAGNWHNLELTNGHIVTDAFVVGSGFITAQAIKNKTYMEPQTKHQVTAQCLADLAQGYAHKYGYDSFVMQCVDSVLKYDTNNLTGLMLKANYETIRFEYVVNQAGRPHPEILKSRYPEIYRLMEERNATYSRIDESGHRDMPDEAYQSWLNSVNEEKERREYNEKYNKVIELVR